MPSCNQAAMDSIITVNPMSGSSVVDIQSDIKQQVL